jgi:hypothetical protein
VIVKRIRIPAATLLAAGFFAVAGCGGGGERFAPVSGIVTIDGKPYDKAVVSFQPIAQKGSINAGMGSSAYTDENGKFVLKCMDGRNNGAVVGRHVVRIMTKGNNVMGQDPNQVGSPDGDVKAPSKAQVDPIPAEWNSASTKEFEVPSGGTDKANFDIVTPKKGGKK